MDQYPAPSLDGLLTVGQAAKLCSVREDHVKAWINTRRLAAFCPNGTAMFVIHPKDLRRFCDKHTLQMQYEPNQLEKVVAQMRQYVHEDDTAFECRASGKTLTAWANTIEQAIRREVSAVQTERKGE